MPSLFPEAVAFPEAVKGNLPMRISLPASMAFFSVRPTEAISGVV